MARYSPLHPITLEALAVGDLVRLRWNGYGGVPGWLHGGWATVVKLGRARVAIRAHGEAQEGHPARWARMDQISEHEPVASVRTAPGLSAAPTSSATRAAS